MASQSNLAATLGGWSARHRITAITGWVVLVLVSVLIASAVGQITMKQSEYGTGESGRATRLLTDAGITEPAQELVLVHSGTATARCPLVTPAPAAVPAIPSRKAAARARCARPSG